MNSLVPVFTKNIVTFTTPWANMGSGGHYWVNTSGSITSDASFIPATAIHGPFDISANGGADVIELVGYFLLGTTAGTACSACTVRISAWGETSGSQAMKDMISVTGTPTFSTGITVANHAKQIAGLTTFVVQGSYNGGTTTRGRMTRASNLGDIVDSFPLLADDTVPTAGDIAQMSCWIFGPGVDSNTSAGTFGSAMSLLPFKRIWLAFRLLPIFSGAGLSTPAAFGGLSMVGYRASKRTNPIEHNVLGVKPFGPLTTEWV